MLTTNHNDMANLHFKIRTDYNCTGLLRAVGLISMSEFFFKVMYITPKYYMEVSNEQTDSF